mmetsp:Transcript_199/g.1428  ORF Transcript_199/g.1428 Transcript_199/m.1428 type:complete len:746 (-) Transcript_199:1007-3244(-)
MHIISTLTSKISPNMAYLPAIIVRNCTSGEPGVYLGVFHPSSISKRESCREADLSLHCLNETSFRLDAIIAGSGRTGQETNQNNEEAGDVKKTEYVSYRQEKFLFSDGRKGIRFYLVDKDGNSVPAVLGEERDTRDGHYMYRREETFMEGTPLCCGNLAGVHKWIRELLTCEGVEDMIERGMFKRSAFGGNNAKRHRSDSRSTSKVSLSDRGAAGNKVERAKKHAEEFSKREKAKYEVKSWLHHHSTNRTIDEVNQILPIIQETNADAGVLIDALKKLGNIYISLPVFSGTGVAEKVADLKQHPCMQVAEMASSIQDQWRRQMARKIAILTTVFRPQVEILAAKSQAETAALPKVPGQQDLVIKNPPVQPPDQIEETPLIQKKRLVDAMATSPKVIRPVIPPSPSTPKVVKRALPPPSSQKLPLGKGRKLCEWCNLVVGSPTRICPYCQARLPLKTDVKISKSSGQRGVAKKVPVGKADQLHDTSRVSKRRSEAYDATESIYNPSADEVRAVPSTSGRRRSTRESQQPLESSLGSKRTARRLHLLEKNSIREGVGKSGRDNRHLGQEITEAADSRKGRGTIIRQRRGNVSDGSTHQKRGADSETAVHGRPRKRKGEELESHVQQMPAGKKGAALTERGTPNNFVASLPTKPSNVDELANFLDGCRDVIQGSPHDAMEQLVKEVVASSSGIFASLPNSENLLKRLKRLENKVASIHSAYRVSDQTQVKREIITLIDNLIRVLNKSG